MTMSRVVLYLVILLLDVVPPRTTRDESAAPARTNRRRALPHTKLPRLVTSEAHLLALAGGSGFAARIHARRW